MALILLQGTGSCSLERICTDAELRWALPLLELSAPAWIACSQNAYIDTVGV